MRYRDLPVVKFTPKPCATLAMPAGADIGEISINPGGDLTWTAWRGRGGNGSLFAENGAPIAVKRDDGKPFGLPMLQRFLDGRLLVVEPRTLPHMPNAFLFAADGSQLRSFYIGDGIQTVLLDHSGKIWVGYFDEGVVGGFSKKESDPEGAFGASGLLRCSDEGVIEFSYNKLYQREHSILDIYALTLDDEDRAWLCPYTGFFLSSVANDRADVVLPKAPTTGAGAISIGPDYFAFFGGYRRTSMIAVVHRATQRVRLIQLQAQDGGTLSPLRLATRGPRAVAVTDNRLFGLDQSVLLEALGPWTDANSSTVESAVQYMEEEASYDEGTVFSTDGSHRTIAGKPRPAGNPPRDDEDTPRKPR